MKKNTGMNGEYHRGCILLGAMRNSAPSEDWCIVDSTTPRMVSGMVKHSTGLADGMHSGTQADEPTGGVLHAEEPFEAHGGPFVKQHGQVDAHAQAHFEQQGRVPCDTSRGYGRRHGWPTSYNRATTTKA